MDELLDVMRRAVTLDQTSPNSSSLREALQLMAALQAMYREVLRQRSADGL